MNLTPRERVEIALNHQEPDRVAWDARFNTYAYRRLADYLDIPLPDNLKTNVNSTVGTSLEMTEALGLDIFHVGLRSSSRQPPFDPNADYYVDEWGVGFRRVSLTGEHYVWELAHHPLADATTKDLDSYPWPDPDDSERINRLKEYVRDLYDKTPFALMGRFNVPPFTQAFYMRGLERWLMDLVANPGFATALLGKITDIAIRLDEIAMKEVGKYISILRFAGDDLGHKGGMLISPRTFRQVVKPHFQRLYSSGKALIKKYAPQAKLCAHTDGDVHPIIPDYIELGLDVLNPVEPVGRMDHLQLKREFGDRLSFHGGLEIQHVLPHGTIQEVEGAVKECIAALGPGGGYILAPTNYVLPDVPPENILTVRDAVMKWGRYPLSSS